mgnify:CR=1 FL=1
MKSFIITIDTEGDNLWAYHKGDQVKTENAKFIPRFQELCNKYGFKPVWLTNYEMVMSDEFVRILKPYIEKGLCEIGIHVHAWNNPPLYDLKGQYDGNPYLIEYPEEVMREKFATTYNLIVERFGVKPVSHRSGRWAMDDRYFKLLEDFNITVDCSYTPGVSWLSVKGETVLGGSDYTNVNHNTHYVGKVLEVPATVRNFGHYFTFGTIRHMARVVLKGGNIWLRPALCSLVDMKKLAKSVSQEKGNDYLEFMVHSSELMPGGSPYFTTNESIERMYKNVEELFTYVIKMGYKGETLQEYAFKKQKI